MPPPRKTFPNSRTFFPRRPCCLRPSLPACGAVSSSNVCSAARVRCPPSSRAKHRRLVLSGGSHLPRASLPRLLRGHAMASPSSQQGAREALPPDQLTALYSLADKFLNASALNRHARAAELSARGALKAEALLGDNSVVVVHLRVNESRSLANLAATASGAEQVALCRRSWSSLLSVLAILERRLASDTLLPGTVRKEESDYYVHVQASIYAAQNKPVVLPADLQILGSTIGCSVLLGALYRSLNFLVKIFQSWWTDAQRKIVESFVRAFLSSAFFPLTLVPTERLCSGISSTGLHPSHSLFSWTTTLWRSRCCGAHTSKNVPSILRARLLRRRAPKMAN